MKQDDSSLDPSTAQRVRKQADLLLRKAEAYGRFPTPVSDLVTASALEIARENALDSVYLGSLYRLLPNSLKIAPDRLKKALGKVIGVLDRGSRTIHLDRDLHPKKVPFVTVHEIGHDFLPWQRQTYEILEDSKTELEPDTRDRYEREANSFASDVLFQLDGFTTEAADHKFGIGTPLDLSKRYGTSIYSAIRRYVTTNDRACALLVFNRLEVVPGCAPKLALRRPFSSLAFAARFGEVAWPKTCAPETFFYQNMPKSKFTPPTTCVVPDLNGTQVECIAEAFDNTYQIFFLIYPLVAMPRRAGLVFASQ